MIRILLCLVSLTIIFSCAEEKTNKPSVKVGLDETGMPIPCDLVVDSFLLNQFSSSTSVNKTPEDIENNPGTMCRYQMINENGQSVAQFVLIIKPRDRNMNRREISERAKSTEYLEDMEFPASWRSISNLKTLVFDYGDYTMSLNLGIIRVQGQESILDTGKNIARHVVDNLEANGIKDNQD